MSYSNKYIIVNEYGTPFNSFYCVLDKKGVFSNTCYSIFDSKKDGLKYIERLKERVKSESDHASDKDIQYWIDKFNNCKVIPK